MPSVSTIDIIPTGDASVPIQAQISIRCKGTSSGWSQLRPEVLEGKLAVHKSVLCFNGNEPVLSETCYTVTHLPTGCSVDEKIEGLDRAKQYLQAIKDLNWDFSQRKACVVLSEQIRAYRHTILGR